MDQPTANDGVRPSPYLSSRSFTFAVGFFRSVGSVCLVLSPIAFLMASQKIEAAGTGIMLLLTAAVSISLDFALRILADIEQHTYRSAQCLSQIVESQNRKREQPVTARVVSPAVDSRNHQP